MYFKRYPAFCTSYFAFVMLPETDFNIRTMTKIIPLVFLTFKNVCIKHKKNSSDYSELIRGRRGITFGDPNDGRLKQPAGCSNVPAFILFVAYESNFQHAAQ